MFFLELPLKLVFLLCTNGPVDRGRRAQEAHGSNWAGVRAQVGCRPQRSSSDFQKRLF